MTGFTGFDLGKGNKLIPIILSSCQNSYCLLRAFAVDLAEVVHQIWHWQKGICFEDRNVVEYPFQ